MTDFELITQPTKYTYVKLELMNAAFQPIQQIQGDLIDFSITISAQSDVRRVSSLTMHVDNSDQLVNDYYGKWLDKMVRLFYGIYDRQTDDIRWWLLGSMLFTTGSYNIDAATRQLSLKIGDMATSLLEQRGSQIGSDLEYKEGAVIKNVLGAIVARYSNYKQTDICDFEDTVPYDISVAKGSYPWSVMSDLVNLFPWYEHYYSREGVYTVKPVPTTMNEPVVMTADQLQQIIVSEAGDVDYGDIKNSTQVWGKQIDANYTALNCNTEDGVYVLQLDIDTYEYGAKIMFVPDTDCASGQIMCVRGMDSYPILKETSDGDVAIEQSDLIMGRAYVVKYMHESFILQGEAYIHVMCMEYNERPSETEIKGLKAFYDCNDISFVINPDSLFACDRIGVVNRVLSDGDYANIYTTKLAFDRAAYENWKTTRLADSVTISALYVPWLDVNQKVEYRLISTGQVSQYIIQQIQVSPMSGLMQVKMLRFMPLYPWQE